MAEPRTGQDGSRLLRALARQPVDRTPVWLMRQAGRYLPEYRKTREKAGSFLNLCTTPELACEVALQPLRRFPLDAAILFSDILTIPHAMGLGLHFVEGEGPAFERPVRTPRDVDRLAAPDPEEDLRYVVDTVRLLHAELAGRVPLIGFAGSPWTLATYMVEGRSSAHFARAKGLLYEQPRAAHRLLKVLAESVRTYLRAQAEAGANVLMIFDTWGSVLAPDEYRDFSLAYLARIVRALKTEVDAPIVLFGRGGGQWLNELAATGCDALGVDWTVHIGRARREVGDRVALQGNLDPCVLYTSPATIRDRVRRVLDAYGPGPGHVFNLGHGLQPGMDPARVAALVDAVHEFGAAAGERPTEAGPTQLAGGDDLARSAGSARLRFALHPSGQPEPFEKPGQAGGFLFDCHQAFVNCRQAYSQAA